jgi:hypothetical protein
MSRETRSTDALWSSNMNKSSSARALVTLCTLAAALAATACASSDLAGNNLQTVSVSFTAASAAGAASVIDGSASVVSSTPAVVPAISKVQLVLTKMEFARTDDAACVDDEDDEDDDHVTSSSSTPPVSHECEHVSRDPVLVDMPVDGTLKTQLSVPLAAGTYKQIEAKLEPVSSKNSTGAAFLAAHPDFAGISVRVDGTFNGAPFTYKTGLRAGIHMKFNPPLVIDATTKNATISVDVSKWFVTGSGAVIDPTKATPGTSAARTVESNIRTSFRAFEDNHHHGSK